MSKFYVTTTIPYVNAKPHIGNAMDWIYADILARYKRSLGYEVLFSVGADEHGLKNLEKAQEAGMDPKQYVDQMSLGFNEVFKSYNIKPDRFIKTSDEAHKARVQIIWQQLANYIYTNKYVGYYCVGCEEYKTETHVKETKGVCPDHDRKYEMLEEDNYFFKLSEFSEKIKQAIESEEMRVVPDTKKNEILSLINKGLEDISISRPRNKLPWGVEVPGDPTQTVYIWFEALMNYITLLGYPENEDFKKYWPAEVQILGKGVLRQHAATWPAILLALGLELPKDLYVHGYWSVNGREVSKTIGNVVYPEDMVRIFGTDASRYLNARYLPSYKDGDFTWLRMLNMYNDDLVNGLGNTIQRVAAMIVKYLDGNLSLGAEGKKHDDQLFHEALSDYRFDKALEWIWNIVDGVNKYIEDTKPWQIYKNESGKEHLTEVLMSSAADLRELGKLLSPFMPQTSALVEAVFGGEKVKMPEGPVFPRVELPGELTAQKAV